MSISAEAASHFRDCILLEAAKAVRNIYTGDDTSACAGLQDCIELDHYPTVDQGPHGTCWRHAGIRTVTHAVSKEKGFCPTPINPFTKSARAWNFALQGNQEAGCDAWIIDDVNRNGGYVDTRHPYVFSCKGESELMSRLSELSLEDCYSPGVWKVETSVGTADFGPQFSSAVCQIAQEKGKGHVAALSFTDLMVELRARESTGQRLNARSFGFDFEIDKAVSDSLVPEPEFHDESVFLEHKLILRNRYFPGPELYQQIKDSLQNNGLPLTAYLCHIPVSLAVFSLPWLAPLVEKVSGACGSHVVVITGARTNSDGKKQYYFEDSRGTLEGWHSIEFAQYISNVEEYALGNKRGRD